MLLEVQVAEPGGKRFRDTCIFLAFGEVSSAKPGRGDPPGDTNFAWRGDTAGRGDSDDPAGRTTAWDAGPVAPCKEALGRLVGSGLLATPCGSRIGGGNRPAALFAGVNVPATGSTLLSAHSLAAAFKPGMARDSASADGGAGVAISSKASWPRSALRASAEYNTESGCNAEAS